MNLELCDDAVEFGSQVPNWLFDFSPAYTSSQ